MVSKKLYRNTLKRVSSSSDKKRCGAQLNLILFLFSESLFRGQWNVTKI